MYLNTALYNTGDKIFSLCNSLYQQGLVLTVEPVFVRLNAFFTDPLYPNQWNIANTGQYGGTPGADMHVADTWCLGYTGLGVRVAVLDLGVDLNHPDLQGQLLAGIDETGNNSGGACDAADTHGTSCAGIIAELNNNIGARGVAFCTKIIPIRVGRGGTINDSWAANGITWAVNNNADILSNSWGGGSSSSQLDQAIQNAIQNGRGGKGSVVLFAAGNNNDVVSYPATNSNTIAVGASCECDTRKRSSNNQAKVNPGVKADPLGTSCDGEFWWGGNFGTGLDVMAPGVLISTITNGTGGNYANAYVTNFNGTSAACPNTAAVLALILSVNPNLTGQAARNILESNCEKVGGYNYQSNVSGQPNGTWSTDAGYGRVNAFGAVASAIATITSISGLDNFCSPSPSTYTIAPPTGLAVSNWSATPSGIVNISSNGNSASLTKTSSGTIVLQATLNNQCRGGALINKTVIVGSPNSLTGTYSTATSTLPLQTVNFVPAGNIYAQYQWPSVSNPVATLGSGSPSGTGFYAYPNMFSFNIASGQSISVNLMGNGTCGTVTATRTFIQSSSYSIVTSPNPASSNINLSISEVPDTSALTANKQSLVSTSNINGITKMYLYDANTGILIKQWTYQETKAANYNLNIVGIKAGDYILRMERNNKKASIKVLIK